ncbi:MAG: carbamoyltransferase HypF [Xenococcaceae cyanobacterium]
MPDLPKQRLRLTIRGAVQGVGFRPFIYQLATELRLAGWVNNSAQGVSIEIEGSQPELEEFLLRIEREKPPLSFIQSLETLWLQPAGYTKFEIRPSIAGEKTAVVLPDIATCPDCLREIFDPMNRRYHYPFTNCTNCGPRYTIIETLPYDRKHTTMKVFQMCPECQAEYENPLDRRFHAQPNACPQCGPQLELWDTTGKVRSKRLGALLEVADAIRQGKIVAVKGLGGFHLMVDARNKEAVQRLRQCKRRPHKPFALMYPSLELIKEHCEVSEVEQRLLRSPEAPIVLLGRKEKVKRKDTCNFYFLPFDFSVAPGNPYLGVMLPYTPLHHLLMAELDFPAIATSGNLSDEPICIDEEEARQRLKEIADLFLVHNRPIVRPVDDSLVRIVMGREMVLRRARGYAPLPIPRQEPGNEPKSKILAVGAHLKNTIAIALKDQIFISQHIGDLETPQAFEAFEKVISSFKQLYEFQPEAIACDAHPDYLSTQYARSTGIVPIPVQHHYAHVLACMAENQLLGKTVLGVAWDGTGYGLDGTIWGGEFLLVSPKAQKPFQRVAHLRQFPLPGGDRAVKEPRRVALGLLYELFGDELFAEQKLCKQLLQAFSEQELGILSRILPKNFNTPLTSSIGRLFDGVAAIINLCKVASFEGQAAMQLEFALDGIQTDETYPISSSVSIVIDWQSIILGILDDVSNQISVSIISAKFHNTLVEIIVRVAQEIGEERVVLTGGCFQNKYLTERTIYRLKMEGFCPYWHQRVPPNDGGIAFGQVIAAINLNW